MSASSEHFANYYRGLADEELLSLALQKQDLLDSAVTALDAELTFRGLGDQALREFAERIRAEDEFEPEVESQKAHDEPQLSTELPQDWFDDESEGKVESPAPPKPRAVTAVSMLFGLGGFVGVALGILQISGGVLSSSQLATVNGTLLLILGTCSSVAAFGLWRLHMWGRKLALALCWVSLALSSINIAVAAYTRLQGFEVDPQYALRLFVDFVFNFIWVLYFSSESARSIFRMGLEADLHKPQPKASELN